VAGAALQTPQWELTVLLQAPWLLIATVDGLAALTQNTVPTLR